MAPLKNRINRTLHKINDKLKRGNRLSQAYGQESAAAMQPRTLASDGSLLPLGQLASQSSHVGNSYQTGECASQLPSSSGSSSSRSTAQEQAYSFGAPPSASVELLNQQSVLMKKENTALPHGTSANPIDLTDTPNPSSGTELIDLTSAPSATTNQGRKRSRAEPPPQEPMDVDDRQQKGKTSVSATMSTSKAHRTGRAGDNELLQPNPDGRLVSNLYRTEDDLVNYGRKIVATRCKKCSHPMFGTVEDVVTRAKDLLGGKGVLHPLLSCARCKNMHCAACPVSTTKPEKLKHKRSGPGVKLAWCCDEGRLFLIWSLCCGSEFMKLESSNTSAGFRRLRLFKTQSKNSKPEQTTPVKAPGQPPQTSPKAATRALSKGVGFGSSDGTNPSGASDKWDAQLVSTASEKYMATLEEQLLAAYFSALTTLLPSFEATEPDTHPFESIPPPMLEFMLRRSPLLPKAAELLRMESLEAMSARRDIYDPLLGFVGTISRHTSTAAVIYSDYTIYPLEEQLCHFSTAPSASIAGAAGSSLSKSRGKGKQQQLEQGSSIVNIVATLARQCRHLTQVAAPHMAELTKDETSKMFELGKSICDLAAEHENNQEYIADDWSMVTQACVVVKQQAVSNVLTRSKDAERARDELRGLHRDASVKDMPDAQILYHIFHYMVDAVRLNGNTVAKGRMKKLVAQIVNLRTSLPEGVWVRHGSSRLDCMKVLMVGPKDTPYENGLFEFDLFCPAEFPNTPPVMHFRTTGGGAVRFNPNLYEDGKVCLSLLGTWPGETWNGAYSTLLQVLVSIHGMILVAEPYYNEPGRERRRDDKLSQAYNLHIMQFTMQHAITHWLDDRLVRPGAPSGPSGSGSRTVMAGPPGTLAPYSTVIPAPGLAVTTNGAQPRVVQDDPVWGDIIRKHFAANGKAILDTTKKWNTGDKGKELRQELQEALTRHGFV